MALRRRSQAILTSIVRGGLHRSALRAFQTTVTRLFDVQSEDDFEKRVLEAKTPVIVDFHAGWCKPCLELAPVLEKYVKETNGKVDIAKVNVDDLQDLAIEYEVASIPFVVGFNNGKPVNSFVGLQTENDVKSFVDSISKSETSD